MLTKNLISKRCFSLDEGFSKVRFVFKNIYRGKAISDRQGNSCMLLCRKALNDGRLEPEIVYPLISCSTLSTGNKIAPNLQADVGTAAWNGRQRSEALSLPCYWCGWPGKVTV